MCLDPYSEFDGVLTMCVCVCVFVGEPLGRVTFELFKDVVPKTAENFRQFCTGESKDSVGRPQGYKGSKFHRIVRFSS